MFRGGVEGVGEHGGRPRWPARAYRDAARTGEVFADACARLGSVQSMGRVGSAFDNAAAESFNSTLEPELLSRRRFATRDHARREVAAFIDNYNHGRRHSSCQMMPPVAYEQILDQRAAEQARQARAA